MTAWWFVAIAAAALALSWWMAEPVAAVRFAARRVRPLLPMVLGAAVGWLAGVVPFALTYFPILATGRTRTCRPVWRADGFESGHLSAWATSVSQPDR